MTPLAQIMQQLKGSIVNFAPAVKFAVSEKIPIPDAPSRSQDPQVLNPGCCRPTNLKRNPWLLMGKTSFSMTIKLKLIGTKCNQSLLERF